MYCLVQNHAVPTLINLVQQTKHENVRDQAMWAICNLTSDANACMQALLITGFIDFLLQLIGLQCNHYNIIASSLSSHPSKTIFNTTNETTTHNNNTNSDHNFINPEINIEIFQMIPLKTPPTLSVMRYVAFICNNIAKLKYSSQEMKPINLQYALYKILVFIMSELIQSPVR